MPVRLVDEIDGFELIFGKQHYLFRSGETPFNNALSAELTDDKYTTNQLLARAGLPVPISVPLHKNDYQAGLLDKKLQALRFPLVIKPLYNGAKGIDVLCNIKTREELSGFLLQHFQKYDFVLIEEFHANLNSWRVLVFRQRIIGVVQRLPASVTGDGIHSIAELVAIENNQRQLIVGLAPILIDDECLIRLAELGVGRDTIVAVGETVVLCYTSNASRGGVFKSCPIKICRSNRQQLLKAAAVMGLTLTGIDIECVNLTIPFEQTNGVIIEVNRRPSLRIHELPLSGRPCCVTGKIIRSFIYRHPFAYTKSLLYHRKLAVYLRSIIAFMGFMAIYLAAAFIL